MNKNTETIPQTSTQTEVASADAASGQAFAKLYGDGLKGDKKDLEGITFGKGRAPGFRVDPNALMSGAGPESARTGEVSNIGQVALGNQEQ